AGRQLGGGRAPEPRAAAGHDDHLSVEQSGPEDARLRHGGGRLSWPPVQATTETHPHHGHSHGLVGDEIKRSREGVRAVLLSLAVLGLAAVAQTAVFVLSGSVALLADLIHNFGDALTAVPLGAAFLLRSRRAEELA